MSVIVPNQLRRLAAAALVAALGLSACLVEVHSDRTGDTDTSPDATAANDSAQTAEPTLSATPSSLDFGQVSLGVEKTLTVRITNTGDAAAVLGELAVSDPAFDVTWPSSSPPPSPATLPAGGSVDVAVTFEPTRCSGSGELTLAYTHEGGAQQLLVPLRGTAGGAPDPAAVPPIIAVAEGDEVSPGTTLHLSAGATCPGPGVAGWEWEVAQPVGAQGVFVPSASVQSPTFTPTVIGDYTFTLRTTDVEGVRSPAARATVQVALGEGIAIELVWDTPGDVDESDGGPAAGSDLDLHFLWLATPTTTWFDDPFDAYWHNPHPAWGGTDPAGADDPSMDRDDSDGGGSERISLRAPQEARYKIGVHYWDAHEFGAAFATVRVYVHGALHFECKLWELVEGDLWEVATLDWPSQTFSAGCGSVQHGYPRPAWAR